MLTIERIYEHYCRWCRSLGIEPARYGYWVILSTHSYNLTTSRGF